MEDPSCKLSAFELVCFALRLCFSLDQWEGLLWNVIYMRCRGARASEASEKKASRTDAPHDRSQSSAALDRTLQYVTRKEQTLNKYN